MLAALDKIGADVGEPIDITQDAQRHRVVVHANGLSADRQQQIEMALKPLPRVVLNFNSGGSSLLPAPICYARKVLNQYSRAAAATP